MKFFYLPWETKSKFTILCGTLIVASTMLLTIGLQLNQVAAESNYNQPYALPLNSRLGSLNEDVLTSNEIKPFKTKGGQNIDGSFNTFQANPGSGAWSDFETLGGGIRSNTDPAVIANSDGRLEVFVVSTDNQLWHRWQTSPGSSTWSAWSSLGGTIADSPAVTINSDGRLEVFVVATDNQLWHRWQTAPGSSTWSAWSYLGGTIAGSPAVTINSDGRLEVFVVATDNLLWHRWQTSPGSSTWSAWSSLGGTIAGSPAVTINSDGRLEVFVVGANGNALYHKWQTSPGSSTSWSSYVSLGGTITGIPAVTRNSDGRLEVFVVGANGNALYHKWQTAPGSSTSWSNYVSLGGTITGNPAVTRNSDGRLEVFVVGANDNALYHIWQTSPGSGTWSAYESLGGGIKHNTSPAVIINSGGRLEVFVVGINNGLLHKWQTPPPSATGILFPMYMYPTLWQPGNPWEKLSNIAKAHPTVPIHAIINPNSGPGTQQDSNFVNGIAMLKAAGVKVWGYTYTQYGTRPTADVKSDIDRYTTLYPGLHGILFDEMNNQAGSAETYYTDLTQYAKSKGFVMTCGNPGTSTVSSYVGTADTLTIYEGSSIPSSQTLASRTFNGQHDKNNFNYVAYAVSPLNEAAVRATLSYVGFLYVTEDVAPNPWDTLPSYLEQLVRVLES